MTILITGVAGMIGARFADWVVENHPDVNIVGIDDLSGGYIENVNKNVKYYKMNISVDYIEQVFENNKIDVVYHFAAYAAEGLSPFIRRFNYQNNLVATADIINNCINYDIRRLVFTSSMAVYGDGQTPFSENIIPNPIDPYGVAKYACEMDIKIAGEQHGLDWCIIRPHNVYGIKQNIWDKYRNVLGIWMYQHINGKPMSVFGDGKQTRAFSFIDDCLESLWIAGESLEASKQIINLGGTKEYSIIDAANILKQVIGSGEIIHLEPRHEVKYAHSTWDKSVKLLNYSDKTDLYNGLKQMWDWAKSQPNREQFLWTSYEVSKKLYTFWQTK